MIRTCQARGFTLVEMQIALLLVAIISVLMAGALRIGTQTWSTVGEKQDIAEHRHQLMQMLRRHLTDVRYIRVRDDGSKLIASIFGNEKQVSFAAPFPSIFNDGNLYWWTLKNQWNEDQQTQQLIFEYMNFDPAEPVTVDGEFSLSMAESQSHILVVADGVELSEIAYFGAKEQLDEQWYAQWQPDMSGPVGLKLRLRSAERHHQFWPELVVAPRYSNQNLYSAGSR